MAHEIKVSANMSDTDRAARVVFVDHDRLSPDSSRALVDNSWWETTVTMNEEDVRTLHEELGKVIQHWDSPAEFGEER